MLKAIPVTSALVLSSLVLAALEGPRALASENDGNFTIESAYANAAGKFIVRMGHDMGEHDIGGGRKIRMTRTSYYYAPSSADLFELKTASIARAGAVETLKLFDYKTIAEGNSASLKVTASEIEVSHVYGGQVFHDSYRRVSDPYLIDSMNGMIGRGQIKVTLISGELDGLRNVLMPFVDAQGRLRAALEVSAFGEDSFHLRFNNSAESAQVPADSVHRIMKLEKGRVELRAGQDALALEKTDGHISKAQYLGPGEGAVDLLLLFVPEGKAMITTARRGRPPELRTPVENFHAPDPTGGDPSQVPMRAKDFTRSNPCASALGGGSPKKID